MKIDRKMRNLQLLNLLKEKNQFQLHFGLNVFVAHEANKPQRKKEDMIINGEIFFIDDIKHLRNYSWYALVFPIAKAYLQSYRMFFYCAIFFSFYLLCSITFTFYVLMSISTMFHSEKTAACVSFFIQMMLKQKALFTKMELKVNLCIITDEIDVLRSQDL